MKSSEIHLLFGMCFPRKIQGHAASLRWTWDSPGHPKKCRWMRSCPKNGKHMEISGIVSSYLMFLDHLPWKMMSSELSNGKFHFKKLPEGSPKGQVDLALLRSMKHAFFPWKMFDHTVHTCVHSCAYLCILVHTCTCLYILAKGTSHCS